MDTHNRVSINLFCPPNTNRVYRLINCHPHIDFIMYLNRRSRRGIQGFEPDPPP